MGEGYPLDDESLREEARRHYDRGDGLDGMSRQEAAIVASARDLRRDAPRIAVPTLVLHGRDDPLIPLAHGRHLAEVVPNAELKVVDGLDTNCPKASGRLSLKPLRASRRRRLCRAATTVASKVQRRVQAHRAPGAKLLAQAETLRVSIARGSLPYRNPPRSFPRSYLAPALG